jgi:hypothetical protein
MKQPLPFLYTLIQGSIGKSFVIKHYRYGVVMTRYPNMKNIRPSKAQKVQRNLFKEAVSFAQWVLRDPERTKAYLVNLPIKKRRRPFQALISYYSKSTLMIREKLKAKIQRSCARLKPSLIKPMAPTNWANLQLEPLWQNNGSTPLYKCTSNILPDPFLQLERVIQLR